MRCGIYLPAIQLPPRRTGSRTASASSSLRRFHRISKTINKSGGSPTESRRGNQIKQGKLAYLHRGRRRRCTCGRGRPRPRSTASRSPRIPRSWLLLAARLDLLPPPAAESLRRHDPTGATRRRRIERTPGANLTGTAIRVAGRGEIGRWLRLCLIGSGELGEMDTRGISTLPLFVLETAWWARKISGCRGLKQAADGSCGLAASRARHGVWTRIAMVFLFLSHQGFRMAKHSFILGKNFHLHPCATVSRQISSTLLIYFNYLKLGTEGVYMMAPIIRGSKIL